MVKIREIVSNLGKSRKCPFHMNLLIVIYLLEHLEQIYYFSNIWSRGLRVKKLVKFCGISMCKSRAQLFPKQGFHFLESPGMSWNRAKCPGKSWKLMNFRKLRFIGIWNDGCCSISFYILRLKMSWKLTQKCLGRSWKCFKTFEWEPCYDFQVN